MTNKAEVLYISYYKDHKNDPKELYRQVKNKLIKAAIEAIPDVNFENKPLATFLAKMHKDDMLGLVLDLVLDEDIMLIIDTSRRMLRFDIKTIRNKYVTLVPRFVRGNPGGVTIMDLPQEGKAVRYELTKHGQHTVPDQDGVKQPGAPDIKKPSFFGRLRKAFKKWCCCSCTASDE